MNILLLGSGGREHALAWKMAQSQHCNQLYIAPGNPGTLSCGTNVALELTDFKGIEFFCVEKNIDIVVVGPEEPLVNGIYDFLMNSEEIKKTNSKFFVVGPSKKAAQLEGSKSFSKKFMKRHNIPTASYKEFTIDNFDEGKSYILNHPLPIVLKADGLAAGKGVVICDNYDDAISGFTEMILNKQFGDASKKVVIEQFLEGIEISVFVLTNGSDYKIIGHAKDYKRINEGDTGLNTGGMGCVSPVPFATEEFMQKLEDRIIKPTVLGLESEELIYNGFIFFGLIKVGNEPFVIEYNCRLGDPETEVVIPRLKTDIVALFAAMDNGTLRDTNINFDERSCSTVMAVSKGYPESYEKGKEITGINEVSKSKDSLIFHASTKLNSDGKLVTNGGRVLAITSFGNSIKESVFLSIKTFEEIYFEGMNFRKDIGYEFN